MEDGLKFIGGIDICYTARAHLGTGNG